MLKGQIFSCILHDTKFNIEVLREGHGIVQLNIRNYNFIFNLDKTELILQDNKIIRLSEHVICIIENILKIPFIR